MPSRVVRLLTIFLFSGLVAVFVAYKSGYLNSQTAQSVQNPISAETAEEAGLPKPELNIDFSDSAFIIAASSKSMVATDQTPLREILDGALKKRKENSSGSDNAEDSVDIDDRLFTSTKVIIPTNKEELASMLRDFFTEADKPLLTNSTPLHLEKDSRFDSPPKIRLNSLLNSTSLPAMESSGLTPVYSIHKQLASTSKSIVVANHSALATDMKHGFNQYWRKIFAPYHQSIDSALINQDSVSQQMLAKIDSLSYRQRMLMLSSKSGVPIDQTRLADSLINLWQTALKFRLDSLSKENRR